MTSHVDKMDLWPIRNLLSKVGTFYLSSLFQRCPKTTSGCSVGNNSDGWNQRLTTKPVVGLSCYFTSTLLLTTALPVLQKNNSTHAPNIHTSCAEYETKATRNRVSQRRDHSSVSNNKNILELQGERPLRNKKTSLCDT